VLVTHLGQFGQTWYTHHLCLKGALIGAIQSVLKASNKKDFLF